MDGKDADDAQVAPPSRLSRGWFRLFNQARRQAPLSVLDLAVMHRAAEVNDGDDALEGSRSAGATSSGLRFGLILMLAVTVTLAGLGGWLGYQVYSAVQEQRQDARFLEVGKQAAVKLTSISHADADDDVKRILESATGSFADDFRTRSQAFVAMVKHVQSTTVGTVAEAGLEQVEGNKARILVAVSVKTTLGNDVEQPTRLWRMRIEMQKIGDQTKVSNVEFVP